MLYIVGNWKMNGRLPAALSLCQEVMTGINGLDRSNTEIVLCPPAPLLSTIRTLIKDTNIKIGGQDCHNHEEGAFTGDYSAGMIRDVGADYVILGHSERRQYYGEDNALIWQKANQAWAEGLRVIYCVGETLEQRNKNQALEIIKTQLTPFFDEACKLKQLLIAYEPVWAIGTGKTATPEDADQVHQFIRGCFEAEFGKVVARDLAILYGGSMKPDNAAALLAKENIDGGLIGGASLEAFAFLSIIKATTASKKVA